MMVEQWNIRLKRNMAMKDDDDDDDDDDDVYLKWKEAATLQLFMLRGFVRQFPT